jgi:hypothetical protein
LGSQGPVDTDCPVPNKERHASATEWRDPGSGDRGDLSFTTEPCTNAGRRKELGG